MSVRDTGPLRPQQDPPPNPPQAKALEQPEQEPRTALHSVQISADTWSPDSVQILIDGRTAPNVQSLKVELGTNHPNRVTVVFEPDELEIDGVFEGWASSEGM